MLKMVFYKSIPRDMTFLGNPFSVPLLFKSTAMVYPWLYFCLPICFTVIGLLVYLYLRVVRSRSVLEQRSKGFEKVLINLHQERDWLLKEINHRVKNNLQIMISLLNSQEFFLKNNEALSAVKNSQRRLHAISLAYQKIYEPIHPSEIDMNVYISELVDYIQDEYGAEKNIICNLHICEASLPITSAVPIGLIINEALSNSFKFAFPKRVGGKIEINFICKKEDGGYRLSISDNGVGLPESFQAEETQSLGTSLMMGLSKQLRGELLLKNEQGVSISLDFNHLNPDIEYPV